MDVIFETRLDAGRKGPLAAHVNRPHIDGHINRQASTALHESHREYIRDPRRDMPDVDAYDSRTGIIEGYADIASGRFTDSISHEEIFRNAVKELRGEGVTISEG